MHVIAVNGFSDCYIRPIATYGSANLGVNPRNCPVELAIFIPAGKNNPADVDGDEEENSAGVDERVFPDGFFDRRGRSIHEIYSDLAGGFMVRPISRQVIR